MRDPLEPGSPRRTLWDSLPTSMFIDLSRLESFRATHASLLLKLRHAVRGLPILRQPVGQLPFGSLELLTCGDVPVAYSLQAPRCPSRVGRNYAAVMLRGAAPVEVRRIFIDGNFIIVGDDSALVALINQRRWITVRGP